MGALALLVELEDEDSIETVREVKPTTDVRDLMDRIDAGEPVARTALIVALEQMLDLVRATRADFEPAVMLVRRATPPPPIAAATVHTLIDGSLLLSTAIPMCARSVLSAALDDPGTAALLVEHDDERGVPCFGVSLLGKILTAPTYDEAVARLSDAATFLVSPSLAETSSDPYDDDD